MIAPRLDRSISAQTSPMLPRGCNAREWADDSYKFIDSGQFPEHRQAQARNFFMLHPSGTVEVRYMAPVKHDTLLESMKDDSPIAQLVFTPSDEKQPTTFSIISSERLRSLQFKTEPPLSFILEASWLSFWK